MEEGPRYATSYGEIRRRALACRKENWRAADVCEGVYDKPASAALCDVNAP